MKIRNAFFTSVCSGEVRKRPCRDEACSCAHGLKYAILLHGFKTRDFRPLNRIGHAALAEAMISSPGRRTCLRFRTVASRSRARAVQTWASDGQLECQQKKQSDMNDRDMQSKKPRRGVYGEKQRAATRSGFATMEMEM